MTSVAYLARSRAGLACIAVSRVLLWGAGKAFVAGMQLLPRELPQEVRT